MISILPKLISQDLMKNHIPKPIPQPGGQRFLPSLHQRLQPAPPCEGRAAAVAADGPHLGIQPLPSGAMERDPHCDDLPIKNGDFLAISHRWLCNIIMFNREVENRN